MSLRGRSVLITLAALCAVSLAALGLSAPAGAANPFYADCVSCHAMPVTQAEGLDRHSLSPQPPPGTIQDLCFECHEPTDPGGHPTPPGIPYYWWGPLGVTGSTVTQMCTGCHAPYDPLINHPNDVIPFNANTLGMAGPTSVLPLFDFMGLKDQNPSSGGIACATCHDPHDPSETLTATGKPGYLRIGDGSGDTAALCSYCHTEMGQPTIGYDLFIDSDPLDVTFSKPFPGMVDIQVTVRNRGNAPYPGGWMEVQLDDGSGEPFPVDTMSVPQINPDSSDVAWVSVPDFYFGTGEEVFHFILEPSPLNPVRNNTFVRAPYVPPTPGNLRVDFVYHDSVSLSWDPPFTPGPTPVTYNVYRNGQIVNPWPLQEFETFFTDSGLAPETPHLYWLEAVSQEGFSSAPSNRVAALTDLGAPIRVPEDYATIQDAVNAATPGTTIQVAPGTYGELITFGTGGIALKGQDANSVTLDLSFGGIAVPPGDEISLSGFTFSGGTVGGAPSVTVFNSIFQYSGFVSLVDAGFVTNCIFENTGTESIELTYPEDRILVANSIFLTPTPFEVADEFEQLVLLNNAFPSWPNWQWLSQEINYGDTPAFWAPGPPELYFVIPNGPFYDGGVDVGLPFLDFAPDVGVFEYGAAYTPKRPDLVVADWIHPDRVELMWDPAADDTILAPSYEIYRSEYPDFPGSDGDLPYATAPSFIYNHADFGALPGTTYYYRVRAVTTLKSEPSNTIPVLAGGNPPTAADDSYSVDENMPLHVPPPGVLGNDDDPDGDPINAVLQSGPSFAASFVLHPDGSFDYLPLPDYSGPDSFTYVASDGLNDSNVATVSITVNEVNLPPDAVDDSYTVNAAPPVNYLDVLLNDSDPDFDPLTITYHTNPDQGGTAANLGDHFDYSPAPGFVGVETFTYEISDGRGGIDTALVTVTVLNDPPVANDDSYSVDEDITLNVPPPGVLGNDFDPNPQPLQAQLVSGPANAVSFVLNPDGSFSYTPAAEWSGVDSFTYQAFDGYDHSNAATVTITVNAVNDHPPTAADDSYITCEDCVLLRPVPGVLLNDSDPDGDPLTAQLVSGVSSGTLNLNPDGSFDYAPDPDFDGSDSFSYTAFDGLHSSAVATVDININPINDGPRIVNPGPQNSNEGDFVTLDIPFTDPDSSSFTFSASGLPPGLALDPATGRIQGTLTYESAGSYTTSWSVYDGIVLASAVFPWDVDDVPRAHVASITTGTYVSRGKTHYTADVLVLDDDAAPVSGADVTAHWAGQNADSSPATVTTAADGTASFETNGIKKPSGDYVITIDDVVKSGYLYDLEGSVTSGQYPPPAQSAPVANNDSYSVDEGAGLNVGAPGVLGNDTDAESDPLTAILAGGPSHGSLNLNSDGSFTYTHDGSETTSDSFTYRANDGTVDSSTATVTLTVNAVNDAPTAADDSASTQQDTPVVVDVLANDSDPEGDTLTVSTVTQSLNGGAVTNNGTDVTYTPPSGYTGPDSFDYIISDGNGGTADAYVNVTVTAVNEPPTAVADSATTNEDTLAGIDVLLNDSDPDDDILSISAITQGANGTVTNFGNHLTYMPDPDYHGPDSFTYTADDGNGGTDIAVVSVTVLSVNDIPVAVDDSASTVQDTSVVIDVLANDTDADGDTLTVVQVFQGSDGTVVHNGVTVTYTPDPGYIGGDSFTYVIDDGSGWTDIGTVSVTVTPSNYPPVADAGPDQSGARRAILTFDGSGSYDTGGTIVSWEWDFGDNKTGSGEVVTHKFTKSGTYTVTLTVTDDQGATDTDMAVVTIN